MLVVPEVRQYLVWCLFDAGVSRWVSSALSELPVGGDVGASLIEMHVLIDVIDPGERNEVMMLTVRRTLLRQLDLVRIVQMIGFSDHLSIGRNHVHVPTLGTRPIMPLGRASAASGGGSA